MLTVTLAHHDFRETGRTVYSDGVKDLDHAVMHKVPRLFPVTAISETERIEASRIPCIQLQPGLLVPTGTQSSQLNVLYVR